MDYNWILKKQSGQPALGYHRIYETNAEGVPILVTIYCLPKLDVLGNKKIATVTVFWGCKEGHITDGFFHLVCNDIGELIKNDEKQLFDNSIPEDIEVMFTEHYYSNNEQLPNIEFFTCGDYHIGK